MRIVMNADGACNPNPGQASCGVVVRDGRGVLLDTVHRQIGYGTNNIAEWSALITALTVANDPTRMPGHRHCTSAIIRMDSRLVVEQANRRWKVKDKKLKVLADEAMRLIGQLSMGGCVVTVEWVPRAQNADADRISR